ncbi:hypothetical protein [Streptomyces sp. NPDC048639]|uniref:hypothetical protein n=1 Tax=Streptomyces sp. NPDC048639 TaxID=3365581 RepID=UPI00371FCE6E
MNDQPQNPDGPYGQQDPYAQHDPYGSRPGDPHHQPPYEARHAYRPHDPYAQQAPQPVQPGPYGPPGTPGPPGPPGPPPEGGDWPQPGAQGGPPSSEDPQTQSWRGLTHQDSGQFQHLPPYQQQPHAPGPLPPEQPGPHHMQAPGRAPAPGPLQAAGHPQAPGYAQAPGRTHTPGPAPMPGAAQPSAQPQAHAPGHAPAGGHTPLPGHSSGARAHSEGEGPGHTGGAPAAVAPSARPATSATSLTPAQRARAEGRSPIIPPGMRPALLTAALSALLGLSALVHGPFGPFVLAVPVVLLQALTAAGWYRLNGMWPARQGIALAFAGGLATDIALLATARQYAPTVALGTLGVWCLLVLVLQLRNHSSADERLYALTAGIASTAFTVLAAGHLAAVDVSSDAVVIGAAAVAVAALTRALSLPPYVSPAAALIAAAGVGIVAGGATGIGGSTAALLGAVAGGCALIGLRVASYEYPSRFVHMTAGVALPLAMAGPAVYVLGRALG